MAELVYQDRQLRSRTALALEGLADPTVTDIRIAVAYTTRDGCASLVKALRRRLGKAWLTAHKTLITSFDFYLTDPDALQIAMRAGFDVYRGASPGFAFHPKLYLFDTASGDVRLLVGSANLTAAAHNDNTELGVALSLSAGTLQRRALDEAWDRLIDTAQPLAPADVARYRADRVRNAPKRRPTPRAPRVPSWRAVGTLPRFPDEVLAGRLRPQGFRALWVQAGAMSSSESHNQLELSRFANYYFGFAFSSHSTTLSLLPIGAVKVTIRGRSWPAQPLNWRGAPKMNKMERIYLPTVEQGGLDYANTGVLFTRTGRGSFRVIVMPWRGKTVSGWQQTSAGRGTLFSVGRGSPRICGLL